MSYVGAYSQKVTQDLSTDGHSYTTSEVNSYEGAYSQELTQN